MEPPLTAGPTAPPYHDTALCKSGRRVEPKHKEGAHGQAGGPVAPAVRGKAESREQYLGGDSTNAESDAVKDRPADMKYRLREHPAPLTDSTDAAPKSHGLLFSPNDKVQQWGRLQGLYTRKAVMPAPSGATAGSAGACPRSPAGPQRPAPGQSAQQSRRAPTRGIPRRRSGRARRESTAPGARRPALGRPRPQPPTAIRAPATRVPA